MKNEITKFIISLISGLICFTTVYLSGSFGNASFDITRWSSDVRGLIALSGFFAFVLGAFIPMMYRDLTKK